MNSSKPTSNPTPSNLGYKIGIPLSIILGSGIVLLILYLSGVFDSVPLKCTDKCPDGADCGSVCNGTVKCGGGDGTCLNGQMCNNYKCPPQCTDKCPDGADCGSVCADTVKCGSNGGMCLDNKVCDTSHKCVDPGPPITSNWKCGEDHTCTKGDSGAVSQSACETSCLVPVRVWDTLFDRLNATSGAFSNTLLQSQDSLGIVCSASKIYTFDGFIKALGIMIRTGVNNQHFYGGDDTAMGLIYGLVNIAAFMSQCMQETILYDACDENNWSSPVPGTTDPLVQGYDPASGNLVSYPITAACGQAGQSYQDYACSESEKHMACVVDPAMKTKAVTHAAWYGNPPPLFCAPKSITGNNLGYWDPQGGDCWGNVPLSDVTNIDDYIDYMKSGNTCGAYAGQKAGVSILKPIQNMKENKTPDAGSTAYTKPRTDVEGCCWWGRGVIQTSGPCNIGKLNYFMGKGAVDRGDVTALFPTIDFCANPEAICDPSQPAELKWIAGMFYWINAVQSYEKDGWNYLTELKKFVNGNGNLEKSVTDASFTTFINSVSGIVNRGCHNPPCGTGDLLKGPERAINFCNALRVFGIRTSICGVKKDSQPC